MILFRKIIFFVLISELLDPRYKSTYNLIPTAKTLYCWLFAFEDIKSWLCVSSHRKTCNKSKLINTVLKNTLPGKTKRMLEKRDGDYHSVSKGS